MITSRDNEKLKLVRKLLARRWREKLGLFVAEGEDLVEAAAAAGIEPVELLVAGETVEPALLAEVSTLAHPPRVLGVYRRDDLPREPREVTLALWRVADPGNVGTLIRAADAFGAASRSRPAAPIRPARRRCAPRRARSSACRCALRRRARRAGRARRARRHAVAELELGPVTFVLGAERDGLPEDVVRAATRSRRSRRPARPSR